MKHLIGMLVIFGCAISTANAQLEKLPDLKKGSSLEDKRRISRELINVRDSLNTFLAATNAKSEKEKANPVIRKRLNLAIDKLMSCKQELDKLVEEVAMTADDDWSSVIQDKAYRTVRDVRRNVKEIREDVKDLILITS
jgi:ElaB/YqjD/DUF883 family membrane-anchored ribosome-binding protein